MDHNMDLIKIAAGLLKFSRDTLKGRFPIQEVWSVVHGARGQVWAHSWMLTKQSFILHKLTIISRISYDINSNAVIVLIITSLILNFIKARLDLDSVFNHHFKQLAVNKV